ncbi:condensation domain-containing protein [Streptomyces sp. NPDC004284]|uniref:condensation domain-containing protein n=1 Tax=Streptomyces sp. NPDC004284 TaxID=3364695 RepID=UPI00367D0B1F
MIPLSYAQRRLWFLNRLEGSSPAYNAPVVLRLGSMPDPVALEAAVRDVVERHEVLRTVYPARDEEPYQKILDDADVRFEVEECAAGGDVEARATAFARLPVDITRELPLRTRLFAVEDGTAVLVLLVHHIATDGWSVGCLLADLDAAYRARTEGRAPGWEPLPVQYADYALWQRDMLGDPEDPDSTAYEQLTHWRKALDGIPAETRLPADRPRPTEPGHRGAVVSADLDAGTHRALATVARARRGTFFMVARAALALALRAAGAGEDVVIGTPVAGRPEEDLHELVGFFVNTLALRTDLTGDPGLGALVDRVRETDLVAFAHEDLPFDLLVEDLNPERSFGRHPFFQVMLSAQTRQQDETVRLGAVPAVLDDADLATAKFDLSFHCQERTDAAGEPGGVLLGLQYATDLYDEDTARLLLALFRRALTAFAEQRDTTPLSRIRLLADDERDALDRRHRALAEAARTRTENRRERTREQAGARSVVDPREEILNGLFAEILDRVDVRPGDNFFKLGGHSLLAGKLTNRIRGALGLQAAIRDVFLAPTPRQLLRRLGGRGEGPRRPALRPVPDEHRPDPVPLSYAQRRLWFLNRLEGSSPAYNAPMVLQLEARPDTAVLEAALRDVMHRHEALRTMYPVRDGEPYQRVLDAPEPRVEVEECATREDARARATGFARIPLDVTCELPLRVSLFTVPGDGTAVLVLSVHHIATDGWSVGSLLADLDAAYRARAEGRAPGWEPLPVQYTDYALWQRELLDGEHGIREGQLVHWRKALDGIPAETRLPADRPRPTEPSHRGAVVTAELDAPVHKALAGVARGGRATFFMVVRAALSLALRAAGAGEDVVMGTAVAGRPEEDLHGLVGFFVNTLALRTDMSGDPTLAELVRRVRDGDLAAFAHDDLPFDLLVEDLNPERSLGRHPFFQVMVSAQTAQDTAVTLGGIAGTADGADLAGAKFDLAFHCAETHDTGGEPGGVLLGLQYATDLYDEDTARILLALFQRALTALAERAGDTPLSEVDLLTVEERRGLDRRHDALARALAQGKQATSRDDRATGAPSAADPREEILRGLFAEVLDRDEVLPGDNFFKLGGHSLLAGKLTNRIRGALGLQAAIRDVFLAPTPRGLLRRLGEQGDGPARPPLRPVPGALRPARVPLSAAQLRLWFLGRLEGPSATYNIPVVTRLHRPVEPATLAAALADVADRHEVLRTVYRTADGEPYQQVLAGAKPVLQEIGADGPDALRAAVDAAAGHVFDLAAEIPFRASLVTDGDGGQILVLLVHHIAGDGWSTGCLLADLDTAYRARAEGRAPGWEPLPVQYTDYTLWQHDLLDGEHGVAGEQLAHWREALDGLPPLLALPTDRPRPAETDGAGALTAFEVGAATHRALLRVARGNGATLFMVVQAALAALLTRHGAGTDLAIGTTVAGRADDALHPLVGFFVNTLVLRTDTSGDPDFTELVRRVRASGLAAYSHQDLPFDRLVEHLSPHRSAAHAPLVQVMLQVHAAATGTGTRSVLDGEPVAFSAVGAKSDLTFALTELTDADGGPAGLRGALEYATALYDAETAALLARRLTETLDALAADPGTALSATPYGPPAPAGRDVVLDERGRPAPVRVPGEVHERTPGGGLRATGRRAFASADGTLRPVATLTAAGYPVEPGHVEDVLGRHPDVTGAVVAVRDDRLYAYVTGDADEAILRGWAAERLPEYLAPARVLVVPRLPAPGTHADAAPERETPGPDGRERQLLGIFRDVLGGRPVGRNDNFFKSGGHSLLAVRLLNRIRADFGQDLTLRDVFRNPTAATLARRLADAAPTAPAAAAAARPPAAPTLRRRTTAGARRSD